MRVLFFIFPSGSVQIEEVIGSDLIAHETKVATIDISKITAQELQSVKVWFGFQAGRV